MDAEKSVEGPKKFLEGWVAHRNDVTKTWKKYWMVLKGNLIFIFTSEKTNAEHMFGTLSLGTGTYVSDIKSKKGFKLELKTLNHERKTTKNVFKFAKEDDFHLWKAYILAIATGTIPNDAHLLPEQRLDVYEAIVEVKRNLAPAASSSGLGQRRASLPGGPTTNGTRRPSEPSTRISRDLVERLENVDDEEIQSEPMSGQIQQLIKRQEEIAKKDIGGINLTSSTTTLSSLFGVPLVEIPLAEIPPVSSSPDKLKSPPNTQSTRFLPRQGSEGQRSSPGSQDMNSTSPSQKSFIPLSPHPFYSERNGNSKITATPSWFVNCSRDQAEEILTSTKKLGTVLMRVGSNHPVTGNYSISFRRELEGKVVVSHYNIIRSTEGFKIDVENQHEAMPCLSVVMEFFLSFAGATARPLTCNDLTQLLGKSKTAALPSIGSNDSVGMRSQISSASSSSSSRNPHRQRIDGVGSSPIPTPTGSNRSSSVQSSSGSPGSRTSRVSFDFSSRRTSEPHHGYSLRSSSASSGVFYAGGGSVSSAPGPQRPTFSVSPYSGSLQDSVYNEAVPASPDRVQNVEHDSASLRETTSVPNNLEVYMNHAEITPTGSSTTVGTSAQSSTNRNGSQAPSISAGSSHSSYGFGSHANRQTGPLPGSTNGYGPPPSTYGSHQSQGTYGSGQAPSTYGSSQAPSTYGSSQAPSTYGSGQSPSTYGSAESQSAYGSGPSQSTSGRKSSSGTLASEASSKFRMPLENSYGNDSQSTRTSISGQSVLRSDSQSTVSTKSYGQKSGTSGGSTTKTPPPAPPPKPSSQEIYVLMKPVPPSESDYGRSPNVAGEACGQSTVTGLNGAPQSVKELARILQCAVKSGK